MDEPPRSQPRDDASRSGPPAVRPAAPLPAVPQPAPEPPPVPEPPPAPRAPWNRLTRTGRGTAGLGIGAAALLLWPFSGWSVIPWAAGLVMLVLLALLRLDRLLRGWSWHVAGLVVVGGLMVSTTPWAWALAASIGVLAAGLLRLPEWRLAAVGAGLCVVSAVAFTLVNVQDQQEAAAAQARTQAESRGLQGARSVNALLPTLLNRIARDSPGAVCDNLLAEPARAPFTASTGQPDCVAAVAAIAAQVVDRNEYAEADVPTRELTDGLVVDACAMTWDTATPAGPQLGELTVGRAPTGPTFVVTAFAACGPATG